MGRGEGERLEVVEEEECAVDPQLLEFLSHLGLERYAEVRRGQGEEGRKVGVT